MKYMVMVNNKFMVSVEAESKINAGHFILDSFANETNTYGVIESALAFNKEDMKTDYYFECLEGCETISFTDLGSKIEFLMKSYEELDECGVSLSELEDDYSYTLLQFHELQKKLGELEVLKCRAEQDFNHAEVRVNKKRKALGLEVK